MKKKALLIGCGSEIGSNLILQACENNFDFEIDTVLNQPIENDNTFPKLNQAHSIQARLELAFPLEFGRIKVLSEDKISIDKKIIKLIFSNLQDYLESKEKKYWDVIILATSKDHLNDSHLLEKLKRLGKYIFGMAESSVMTNLYPTLLNFDSKLLNVKNISKQDRLFSLGSCQTNGWLSQFKVVLNILENINKLSIERVEVDIVHPETPTGMIGTKSYSPRKQDSRNNLRPSFSQIEKAMKKLLPNVSSLHTVSLRIPIEEPGYQITRTYFKGQLDKNFIDTFENNIEKFSNNYKDVNYTNIPLGSKAYKYRKAIANILPAPYLQLNNNCFSTDEEIHQIITQAYVSNVHAYCYHSLLAIKYILNKM
jgi:glyceraldehyde-3-phosphate dehydrogenase/erythrose-4-phosphate dehydrogenase